MQNVITSAVFVLFFGFLAVETYREAAPEYGGSYGGPVIHWSARY